MTDQAAELDACAALSVIPVDTGIAVAYSDPVNNIFSRCGMRAYQLTIPVENKPGVIAPVTEILAREKINIRATTISSFGAQGFLNLIVDDPDAACTVLQKEGIGVELKEVIAVLIPDSPGGFNRLVQCLARHGINIENAYGFVIESRKHAVIVLNVRSPETVRRL